MDFLAMKSIKNHVFYGLVSNLLATAPKPPYFMRCCWTKQLNRDKFNCFALSVSETENVQIFRRQYVRPEIFAGGECDFS